MLPNATPPDPQGPQPLLAHAVLGGIAMLAGLAALLGAFDGYYLWGHPALSARWFVAVVGCIAGPALLRQSLRRDTATQLVSLMMRHKLIVMALGIVIALLGAGLYAAKSQRDYVRGHDPAP